MPQATKLTDVPRSNYRCVQALRAVAASLVVLHHSIMMWLAWIVHRPKGAHWPNGAAGVDIFFIISGFVMAISLPGLAGKKNKAGGFLWRRFTRVVPLYWGATTLKVAILKLWPAAAINAVGTPWRILASYLFIPVNNGKGEMYPVLDVGWTLNYEMLFYVLFAVALVLDIAPLAFLTPCLTGLALIGFLKPASWPDFTSLASTMVIEFLYGVILAHLVTRRRLPGKAMAAVLLTAGFLLLLMIPQWPYQWKFLYWGLPAFAIVTGAVALEPQMGGRVPKWMLVAGDASYALYLSHTFVMPFLGNLIGRLHLPPAASLAAAIALGFAISFPLAVLVHWYIEKPMMRFFKERRAVAKTGPVSVVQKAQLATVSDAVA